MKTDYCSLCRKFAMTAGLVAMSHAAWASDDAPPLPQLLADLSSVQIIATDPTALVGASSGAFTFVRTGSASADLVVSYAVSGTASNGVDYTQIPLTCTIPVGYLALDLVIQPKFDAARRGSKTVVLTLQTNSAYLLSAGHKKATVNLVDDTYNDIAPTVSLTSPVDKSVFVAPINITLQAQATDPDDMVAKVSFYANDLFLGQATSQPFSLVWTNPAPGDYALFARAIDMLGKSTLSAPVHITVTNAPPVVTILSPADGAVFTLPANVEIKANVTDSDDTIARVHFYGDGHLLGTLTNSPYSLVWSNVPPGKHSAVVRAEDAVGLKTAAAVSFSVTNVSPAVSISSPVNGANFTAPATILIQVDASDADGSISQVSLYANNRLLAELKESPYSYTWKKVAAGTYTIKAVATDKFGARSVSKSVLISVSK